MLASYHQFSEYEQHFMFMNELCSYPFLYRINVWLSDIRRFYYKIVLFDCKYINCVYLFSFKIDIVRRIRKNEYHIARWWLSQFQCGLMLCYLWVKRGLNDVDLMISNKISSCHIKAIDSFKIYVNFISLHVTQLHVQCITIPLHTSTLIISV